MQTIHIVKKVNNTELGKISTHETYILVPQELDVSDFFRKNDEVHSFLDKDSGKIYEIRLTIGKEKRIVGLGPFYRDKNMFAGDEVILEKRILQEDKIQYYIHCIKHTNNIVLQKSSGAFLIATPERLNLLNDFSGTTKDGKTVKIEWIKEVRRRSDSPVTTKLYEVHVDSNKLSNSYSNNEMLEVIVDDTLIIKKFIKWKKYIMEAEE